MAAGIISRDNAMAQGLARYFTGDPCKNGHVAERFCCNKICAECGRLSKKRRRTINPEKFREEDRRRNRPTTGVYSKYKQLHKEGSRRWRAANPEKCKRAYRKRYAEKSASWSVYRHKRRARKLKAGGSFTLQQIEDLFKKQYGKCAGCFCSIKSGWHNDHIVALSRGGSNDISNIQLLCQPCNNQKHAKDPIEWAQENGRLL